MPTILEVRNDADRVKEKERSKTTYPTSVMQIRSYTGDLRSIISGGLGGPHLSCHSPRDTMPNKSPIHNYTHSADPLRPPC